MMDGARLEHPHGLEFCESIANGFLPVVTAWASTDTPLKSKLEAMLKTINQAFTEQLSLSVLDNLGALVPHDTSTLAAIILDAK